MYGDDRVFVRVQVGDRPDGLDEAVRALEGAGHPVITIDVPYAYGLGGEFLRWEIATTVAGMMLGIDPFDEPNVQEAKDATAAILAQGSLDPDTGGDVLTPDAPALREHLRAARPGDYVAFLAYIQRTSQHDETLARLRASVRYATRAATTLGYGPRYLHSTGQLHKGGPNSGVFLLLTADDAEDVPVPEDEVLRQAQHERTQDEVLRQAQHERTQDEVLRQAQHERTQDEVLRQAQHERRQDEVLRQAQHERTQDEVLRQAQHERTQDEVLRQAQHERTQDEALRQAQHERTQDEVLRQAQHERTQPDAPYNVRYAEAGAGAGRL